MRIPAVLLLLAAALLAAHPAAAVSSRIQAMVDAREAEVIAIRDELQTLYHSQRCKSDRCGTCSVNVCTDAELSDDVCSTDFGTPQRCKAQTGQFLSESQTSVKVAEGVQTSSEDVKNDVCFSASMDSTFISNHDAATAELKWQYIATPSGVMRQYPGVHYEVTGTTCAEFDPRTRPWYVAAATGARSLVIILDVSSSMNNEGRMGLAKEAADSVLSALTSADWFSVVAYAGSTATPNKFATSLVQATSSQVASAKAWVQALVPAGGTDYNKAFTAAFDILDAAKGTASDNTCLSSIVFMTDGASNGATGEAAVLTVRARNAEHDAHIFTYSLGKDAEDAIILHGVPNYAHTIACENRGMWQAIPDGGDLPGKMSGYYQFLASGLSNEAVVWLEPYQDAFGLGLVTTAAIAAYDNTVSPKRLIGVAGVDVRLVDFGDLANSDETLAFLTSKSQVCSSFDLTFCQMQALRQAASAESMCADQSCGAVAVTSNTCPAATKIANDVFCAGTLMSEDTSTSKVCCEVDTISVVAIVAIVVGVAILVCVAGGVYLFFQRKSVKAKRHRSERNLQAATAPPPAPAPGPAPAAAPSGNGHNQAVEMRGYGGGASPATPAGYAYPSYPQPAGHAGYPPQQHGPGGGPPNQFAGYPGPAPSPGRGGPGYPAGGHPGYPPHGGRPGYPAGAGPGPGYPNAGPGYPGGPRGGAPTYPGGPRYPGQQTYAPYGQGNPVYDPQTQGGRPGDFNGKVTTSERGTTSYHF